MRSFREKVLKGEFAAGIWNNLDSSVVTEIIGLCGYDWVLLDTEHRPSTTGGLLHQMQSLSGSITVPIVRVPWLDRVAVKLALDIGAAGIMVPCIDTVEQACEAVSFMRYAPQGVRGVGAGTRASAYGFNFQQYFENSSKELLTVVQIETQLGVNNVRQIAEVDGVDVVFVGPVDLSVSIGMLKRFADSKFMDILAAVAHDVRIVGKAAGILLPGLELLPDVQKMGYSFVAVSSDIGAMTMQLKAIIQSMRT